MPDGTGVQYKCSAHEVATLPGLRTGDPNGEPWD
jgi:hypothetical protein